MKQFMLFKSLPLLALLLLMAAAVSAAAVRAYASEEDSSVYPHVYDNAGVLSTAQQENLEQMCIDYGAEADIDIIILTHNDKNAPYAETYIEDWEDLQPAGDRVYLLVDLYNRDVSIEGFGRAETYIHSKRIDAILDEISPDLSDGNYYEAFQVYIQRSAGYMNDDSLLNYDHNYTSEYGSSSSKAVSLITNVWFQLLAAVIIGAITVSVMAHHSGGRMTAGSSNYMEQNHSGLIGRRDDYLRTQVTRVRRPKVNTNSGSGGFNSSGFRGGTSSGGRSHSSGSRKF